VPELEPAAAGTVLPRRQRFARELTGVIAAPFLIWLVGWGPDVAYIAVVSIFSALALYEFLALGERKDYPVHKLVSMALLLLLLAGFVDERISVELGVIAVLLVIPAFYVFSRSDLEHSLPGSAVSVLGTLYIGMLGGSLLRLRLDFGTSGAKLVFFLLLVVWSGDAGAYYVGKKFGRTKLSPRISPKKTVEGLVGGIFSSLITAAVIHFTFFPEFPLQHALVAATFLSIAGVVGDLAESMWKRSAAVKDSGALIPGHGGFLDRTDSVLFTAPILYTYWFLLTTNFTLR
jgi:phosphatidate cytidylyltransferase